MRSWIRPLQFDLKAFGDAMKKGAIEEEIVATICWKVSLIVIYDLFS